MRPEPNDQPLRVPSGDTKSLSQSSCIVDISKLEWGYLWRPLRDWKTLISQNSGYKLFSAEVETGARSSALLLALRGRQDSFSIFLGSGDFGPFLGSPLRGIVGPPATMCSWYQAARGCFRRSSLRGCDLNSGYALGNLASRDAPRRFQSPRWNIWSSAGLSSGSEWAHVFHHNWATTDRSTLGFEARERAWIDLSERPSLITVRPILRKCHDATFGPISSFQKGILNKVLAKMPRLVSGEEDWFHWHPRGGFRRTVMCLGGLHSSFWPSKRSADLSSFILFGMNPLQNHVILSWTCLIFRH